MPNNKNKGRKSGEREGQQQVASGSKRRVPRTKGIVDPRIIERMNAIRKNLDWDGLESSSEDEAPEPQIVPKRRLCRPQVSVQINRTMEVNSLATEPERSDDSPEAAVKKDFFDGDVDTYINKAFAYTEKDTAGLGTEYDRLTVWTALVGAGVPAPTTVNRRMPTQYETRAARLVPVDEDEMKGAGRVFSATKGGGDQKGEKKSSAVKRKPSRKLLSVRAAEVAAQIKGDPTRIMGVLGGGGVNRRWATAVAQALRKFGIGDGTLSGWRPQVVGSLEAKPQVGALVVKKTIDLWALGNPSVEVEEQLESIGEELESTDKSDGATVARLNREKMAMEEALERGDGDIEDAAYAFSYIMAVNSAAGSLRRERICPFCTFFELGGRACKDVATRGGEEKERGPLLDRLTHGEMGAQWVNAAAEAHNKEMHALNGNIDSVSSGMAAREGRLGLMRDLFWDQACDMTHEDGPNEGTTYETMLANPVVYYARGPDRSSRALTNAGTLHQYFCPGVRAVEGGFLEDRNVRVMTVDGEFAPEVRRQQQAQAPAGNQAERPAAQAAGQTLGEAERQAAGPGGERALLDRTLREGVAVVRAPAAEAGRDAGPRPVELIGGLEAWRRSKWVGVGIDPRLKHGKLQRTEASATVIEAATNPAPSCPGVINPAKGLYTYGYMSNTPLLAAGLDAYMGCSKADYRGLAIKIDLYDELRERRMVQPSGVGYAWAEAQEPERHIVSTRAVGDWDYQAVFVTADVLEAMLRSGGDLLVGGVGGEIWNIRQDTVRVIPIADNGQPDCVGRDAWIASQLTYPLAQVFDEYDVAVVGDLGVNGGQRIRRETFIRTAGLVDIMDRVSKLIFVIPTKTTSSVALGGVVYDVQSCDHRGELPRNRIIAAHDVNGALDTVVRRLLMGSKSLRRAFSDYTSGYFPKGINWLEINSITISLTVRWHQKIEGVNLGEGEESVYYGAPSGVLETMGLEPGEGVGEESYRAYGGWSAVTGMDQRVARRQCARRYPIVRVGAWDNMASLALGTGYAYYDTHNVENDTQIAARCHSGGLDRLSRGRLLRRAFEMFKRMGAQLDGIAFPAEGPHMEKYWSRLIKDPIHGTGTTTSWFAGYFLTDYANYSWAVNQHAQGNGGTYTGIRTPSSYWRSVINTEWSSFCIQGSGRPGGEAYAFDTSRQAWTAMCYAQFGQGEDDAQLEEVVMRLDMNQFVERNWGLMYKTHPHGQQMDGVAWAVDESYGGVLARLLGWEDRGSSAPPADTWGWGVAVRVKDYTNETIKTLVIPRGTASTATGSQFADGTILFRGDIDEKATGLQLNYIDRPMGFNVAKLTARGSNNTKEGNGEGAAHVPGVSPLEREILQMERRLEELKMARTAEERITRNYEDAGPLGWEKDGARRIGTEKGQDPPMLEEREVQRGVRQLEVVQRAAVRPEVLEEHGGREAQDALAAARR